MHLRFNFPLTLLAVFLISAMRSSNSCFISVTRFERLLRNPRLIKFVIQDPSIYHIFLFNIAFF